MEEINVDLHIHGRYSAGTSSKLRLRDMVDGAKRKGIHIIGSGDILHPAWRGEVEGLNGVDEGTFESNGVRLILTAEVEDYRRVHHLIIYPSLSKVHEFEEAMKGYVTSFETDGRPHLRATGEEIAEAAIDADCLIGPCHAFTPWTALYAYYASLRSCYGEYHDRIHFLELGLSADSNYADRLAELQRLTFLSNSDAHSAHPYRLAREFNRLLVSEPSFEEVKRAILRSGGRRPTLNVGFPPEEGKYNTTACTRCYTQYTITDAEVRKWRCSCGGRIKKGVRDRIDELATWSEPHHPSHRPPYVHMIPLSEIIARSLGLSGLDTKRVTEQWGILIQQFGSEPAVLVDAPLDEISSTPNIDHRVVKSIEAFRNGRVRIIPGGGGQYGRVVMPWDKEYESAEVMGAGVKKSSPKGGEGRQTTLLQF